MVEQNTYEASDSPERRAAEIYYLRTHMAHQHAMARVLDWVLCQEEIMISKNALYDAVLEMAIDPVSETGSNRKSENPVEGTKI